MMHIHDLAGKLIKVTPLKSNRPLAHRVDISNLRPGIYVATLSTGETVATARLVVQ